MFFDPGVKINEICYCDVLLPQQLLPAIRQVSDEFIFQRDMVFLRTRRANFLTLMFHKVV